MCESVSYSGAEAMDHHKGVNKGGDIGHQDHSMGSGKSNKHDGDSGEFERIIEGMDQAKESGKLRQDDYDQNVVALLTDLQKLEDITGVDAIDQFAEILDARQNGGSEKKLQKEMGDLASETMQDWLMYAKENGDETQEVQDLIASVFAHSTHTAASAQDGTSVHGVQNGAGYHLMHLFQSDKNGGLKQDILGIENNKVLITHGDDGDSSTNAMSASEIYDAVSESDIDDLIAAVNDTEFFQAAAGNRYQNLNNTPKAYADTDTLLEVSGYLGKSDFPGNPYGATGISGHSMHAGDDGGNDKKVEKGGGHSHSHH